MLKVRVYSIAYNIVDINLSGKSRWYRVRVTTNRAKTVYTFQFIVANRGAYCVQQRTRTAVMWEVSHVKSMLLSNGPQKRRTAKNNNSKFLFFLLNQKHTKEDYKQ